MQYLYAAVGWIMGSFLPTLEATWLAYLQGVNSEKIKQGKEQIAQAYASNAQIAQALDIKQQLDAAGAVGAERMRAWYDLGASQRH